MRSAICLLFVCLWSAGTTADTPVYPFGVFTDLGVGLPQDCPSAQVSSQCNRIRISACSGTTIDGWLSVLYPTAFPYRGVVLMFPGRDMTGWFATNASDGYNAVVVLSLQEQGFVVVQPRFAAPWFNAPVGEAIGMARLACRATTISNWVKENVYDWWLGKQLLIPPANRWACGYCVAGWSSGSSMTGYSLTMYGMDGRMNAAILIAGPPQACIQLGCATNSPPGFEYAPPIFKTWTDQAYGIYPPQIGPCASANVSFFPTFEADSIDSPLGDHDITDTRVVFIQGDLDPQAAPWHATCLHSAIGPSATDFARSDYITWEIVRGMDHAISMEGALAIVRSINQTDP